MGVSPASILPIRIVSEHRPARGIRATATALPAALLAVGLLSFPGAAAASAPAAVAPGQDSVDLGRAAPFVVLAAAGVAATGLPHVRGEVGTYPGPAVSGLIDVAPGGAVHRGGVVTQLAQADVAVAYATAANATPTSATPMAATQGGTIDDATLMPGVYAFVGDPISIGGHIVLDGGGDRDATWIFQAPSGLVTAPGSVIDLVGGAQACNVFWQVAGAATLGAGSTFSGTILATAAVTVDGGVTLDGRLLTTTGRVLLGDGTIDLPVCSASGPAIDTAVPAAAVGATTDRAPPASATGGEVAAEGPPPSALPLVAIALLILAALLGEPRSRRPAAVGPW